MNHNSSPRRTAKSFRLKNIWFVWIRYVNRLIKLAVWFSGIEDIRAFRCLSITRFYFAAIWLLPESHPVDLHDLAISHQHHYSFALNNNNLVSLGQRGGRKYGPERKTQETTYENKGSETHDPLYFEIIILQSEKVEEYLITYSI